MSFIAKYIAYIRDIRRYSSRTVNIYTDALKNYLRLIHKSESVDDTVLIASLNRSEIRQYEVALMEEGLSARTVGLHISALSSFCRYNRLSILRCSTIKQCLKLFSGNALLLN